MFASYPAPPPPTPLWSAGMPKYPLVHIKSHAMCWQIITLLQTLPRSVPQGERNTGWVLNVIQITRLRDAVKVINGCKLGINLFFQHHCPIAKCMVCKQGLPVINKEALIKQTTLKTVFYVTSLLNTKATFIVFAGKSIQSPNIINTLLWG